MKETIQLAPHTSAKKSHRTRILLIVLVLVLTGSAYIPLGMYIGERRTAQLIQEGQLGIACDGHAR